MIGKSLWMVHDWRPEVRILHTITVKVDKTECFTASFRVIYRDCGLYIMTACTSKTATEGDR